MSVVVATNLCHPALLPPTPPRTPPSALLALPPAPSKLGSVTPRSPLPQPAKGKLLSTTHTTTSNVKAANFAPPLPCYSMLRAQHATCIRYVIAKLRWDQKNSGYIPGCDPWEKIDIVIQKLQNELAGVEVAQKSLDAWPNLHHPIAPTAKEGGGKPYGPLPRDEHRQAEEKEWAKEMVLDKQLYHQFPFLKQAFVGPKTKHQAKAHIEMRKIIFEGEFYMDDLEEMMPEENLKAAMNGDSIDPYRKKPTPPAPGRAAAISRPKRMTYDEYRCERENAKIQEQLKEKGIEVPPSPVKKAAKLIGPITKEEYLASLPRHGPKTKGEAMLPIQREQRQVILTWLKQSWPAYDEEAAGLMHKLGTLAFVRLEEKARAAKGGSSRRKSVVDVKKAEEKAKDEDGKGKGQKADKADKVEKEDKGEDKKSAAPAKADAVEDKKEGAEKTKVVEIAAIEVEVLPQEERKLDVQVVEVVHESEKRKKEKIE